jgi:ribosome-associated protein
VTKITKRGTSSARVETTGRADVTTKSRIAARAADDKKGDDILVLDVADIIGIVECFVITSASNTRLVRSIVEEVECRSTNRPARSRARSRGCATRRGC